MKIITNTPDQLILENRPLWLAIFVTGFALLFVAIGLAILGPEPATGVAFVLGGLFFGVVFNMAFIRRTQLILDAPRTRVELRRRSWFGYKRWTWDLKYLERAVLETSRSGDTDTHRAALIINGGMDEGVHPITLVYSSGRGAQRAKDAINNWLAALDSGHPTA